MTADRIVVRVEKFSAANHGSNGEAAKLRLKPSTNHNQRRRTFAA